MKVDTSGVIGSTGFRLRAEWQRHGKRVFARRHGAFLRSEFGEHLVREPLFSAVELAERFDGAATDLPGHWDALARFRGLFEGASLDPRVELAPFLAGIQVFTAEALSLQLRKEVDGIRFDPILFGPRYLDEAAQGSTIVSEQDGLLPEDLLRSFQRDKRTGFSAFPNAKRTYLLGPNSYLVLGDALEAALEVVREKQQSSSDERRGFAANPNAAISERLIEEASARRGETAGSLDDIADGVEERVSRLFVETPEYARRAVEVEAWEPPAVAFRSGPHRAVEERDDSEDGESDKTPIPQVSDVGESHDAQRFVEIEPRGSFGPDIGWPTRLKSELFPHQLTCFRWLVESWAAGQPGVLNADDQGLGKTLETLAFLAWLQDVIGCAEKAVDVGCRGPILVVAPTGLLRTWETEVAKHLDERGLYAAHRVYGRHLQQHRMRGLKGVDTDDGRCRLHLDPVRAAIARNLGHRQWLLTTYQTLTNHQHSFRQICFSTVVFDEIQMLKNPGTLRAVAAKNVWADFRVGLTGTPIENRTADLWGVMDALAPGRLGSLEAFTSRYGDPTEESMRELHDRVFRPQPTRRGGAAPPLVLRRLKKDVLGRLPKRTSRRYREPMPAQQAKAYDEALELFRSGDRGAALGMLQRLRAVSLHPDARRGEAGRSGGRLEDSARLIRVRRILDDLHERGERALLFIESLDMQAFLAQWLRARYGLRDVPVINGSTPVSKRHERVRRFQQIEPASKDFGVFILSPRAAGFGLTLTAATHVVHVSRWWNPAVEEQCNDRIYRIGQTRDVTIHLPMAIHPTERERSFDHVLDCLLERKRKLVRSALWPPVAPERDVVRMTNDILGSEPSSPVLARSPRPPELICRRTLDGWSWTLALAAPDEPGIDEVLLDGEALDRGDEDWEIPSCVGELHAIDASSRVHPIELFTDRPLVFRTATDWEEPGRRSRGIGQGHFLVVAPQDWQRKGTPPIEPEPCGCGFLAHYFFLDAPELLAEPIGFEECPLESTGPGFRLVGNPAFDDVEDCGLFGAAPILEIAQEVRVVHVSTEGWQGREFDPHSAALAAVLGEREGAFILRVYDADGLRDSGRFRLLHSLHEVRVAGRAYSPDTLLLPDRLGHRTAVVRLAASRTPKRRPAWADRSKTSRPDPAGERVEISIATNCGPVSILVRTPRIWWRLETPGTDSADWGDRPVDLTRRRFLEAADTGQVLAVQLPRRMPSVRVAFGRGYARRYMGRADLRMRLVRIPLRDFRDYDALARRSLGESRLMLYVAEHTVEVVRVVDEASSVPLVEREPRTTEPTKREGPSEVSGRPDPQGVPRSVVRKVGAWVVRVLKRFRIWLTSRSR